jgi:hypothetical protein
MSDRRGTKQGTREFTLDQLRDDRPRVVSAAKQEGGCFVVDKEGQRLFSIWIPQTPIADVD